MVHQLTQVIEYLEHGQGLVFHRHLWHTRHAAFLTDLDNFIEGQATWSVLFLHTLDHLESCERDLLLDVLFLFYNLLYSLLDLRYDRVLAATGVVDWEKAERILALHASGPRGH